LLGRLHAVGATRPFEHREALAVENFGHASLRTLLEGNFVPASCCRPSSPWPATCSSVEDIYARTPHKNIRLHGDCHPGNLMCRDECSTSSTSTTAAWARRCRTCG
jgi:Ser/Thr protein kinase RdoA (MazF antagonist)